VPAAGGAVAAGDIVLVAAFTANQAATITNANGGTYTELPTDSPIGIGTAGGGGAVRITLWWSRHNGSQGNPTVGCASGNHLIAAAVWSRGCIASGSPIDDSNSGTDNTGPTTFTIGGVTTTGPNRLIYTFLTDDWDNAAARYTNWANANLASITERADGGTATGNGSGIGIVDGGKVSAGATGNTTVDQNAAITVNAWITLALIPA
jgi:hypothetical protein